jgi:glycosyltransferase involved in cell wall biosynthesis
MAATFTTSKWCVDVLKENGVTVPVHNIPHGVDPKSFPYMERDWNASPFFFLWQGMHPMDRKGRRYVDQAFKELDLKDAWLVYKWYPLISRQWYAKYPTERILEIGKLFRGEHYRKFLQGCHVSINPFRGEGFGMLPLETAATGMATAATAWSGSSEYMSNGYFAPIEYDLCEPGEDYISKVAFTDCRTEPGQDAIPRIESIKEIMLRFYNDRKAAEAMGREASAYIHREWKWERAADIFVDSIKKVLENVRQ